LDRHETCFVLTRLALNTTNWQIDVCKRIQIWLRVFTIILNRFSTERTLREHRDDAFSSNTEQHSKSWLGPTDESRAKTFRSFARHLTKEMIFITRPSRPPLLTEETYWSHDSQTYYICILFYVLCFLAIFIFFIIIMYSLRCEKKYHINFEIYFNYYLSRVFFFFYIIQFH